MSWFNRIFFRKRRYDDLSVSIQEHLDERIDELVTEGLPRSEAERTARREFGQQIWRAGIRRRGDQFGQHRRIA